MVKFISKSSHDMSVLSMKDLIEMSFTDKDYVTELPYQVKLAGSANKNNIHFMCLKIQKFNLDGKDCQMISFIDITTNIMQEIKV